ncbi:MAG: hypothetical protein Q9217_006475 [Psora testacea]
MDDQDLLRETIKASRDDDMGQTLCGFLKAKEPLGDESTMSSFRAFYGVRKAKEPSVHFLAGVLSPSHPVG